MTVSPKAVVLTVFLLNSLAFLFLSLNITQKNKDFQEDANQKQDFPDEDNEIGNFYTKLTPEKEITGTSSNNGPYTFIDPTVAHDLLKKLDVFELMKTKNPKRYSGLSSWLKPNNNYCDEHRAYFVNNPDFVFQKPGIVSNYWRTHKLRTQVIPKIGHDLHPRIYPGTKYKVKQDMRVDANVFFSFNYFYWRRQIGKQFSCLSQSSNHIKGHDKIARKDYVGQALVDYAKQYKSRPTCFSFDKYFPETWILKRKSQCLDFFQLFQSPEYLKLKEERNIVFFRKKPNVHEGKGVLPVNNKQEVKLRDQYKNGTACGKIKQNNMIQKNVYNPLLIQGRKFGLRMYLLIASTNPVIAYAHDGYLRLSMNGYDAGSQKIETFVTNIGVNLKQAKKTAAFSGLTTAEIQERTSWFVEDLHDYLFEIGRVKDPDWLNNYFRPEIKRVMIHLVRMSQRGFFKKSSLFEIYGLDFIMDDNLDLWFIEANAMPLLNGFTKKSTQLINQVLIDTFEIILGLQKSRMKRVIHYINALTQENGFSAELSVADLEERRKEFKRITMNYFEPEFEPSVNNTFEKIVDENLNGTERYVNLIEFDCL